MIPKFVLVVMLITSCFGQLKYDRAVDWNLPDLVHKRLEGSHLLEKYDLSDRLNPFYLRGDFDGDSKPDYAVLVVNRQSKKSAIAVYLSSRDQIEVLGDGGVLIRVGTKKEGYGLADFDWMDAWQVEARERLTPNELNEAAAIPQMKGEGFMVEKTEAASALIYWDGAKFRWYQLAD
jgi:hypothetical protein